MPPKSPSRHTYTRDLPSSPFGSGRRQARCLLKPVRKQQRHFPYAWLPVTLTLDGTRRVLRYEHRGLPGKKGAQGSRTRKVRPARARALGDDTPQTSSAWW